jgi:hypothetical protein
MAGGKQYGEVQMSQDRLEGGDDDRGGRPLLIRTLEAAPPDELDGSGRQARADVPAWQRHSSTR